MGLRTKLETSVDIIRATGALHNLSIALKDPVPEENRVNVIENEDNDLDEATDQPLSEAATRAQGIARRENVFSEFARNE